MSLIRPTMPPSGGEPPTHAGLASARPIVDIVIPRTTVAARLRLLSRAEQFEATAGAHELFEKRGLPTSGSGFTLVIAEWNGEIAVRHLAIAVRAAGADAPLATLEQWRDDADDDQIATLWAEYRDLANRFDPLGATTITEAEVAALQSAAKKKDADLLMSFGSRKLALFITTTADPPAS